MGNKAATKRKTENGEDDIGMDVETARKPTPKAKVKSSDATEAKKASNQANMSGGGTCKNIHEGAENPDSQSESERQADLSSKPSTPKKAKKSPGTKGDKGSSGGDGLPGSPKAIAWTVRTKCCAWLRRRLDLTHLPFHLHSQPNASSCLTRWWAKQT